MTSPFDPNAVRIGGPGDLLAALPYLFGFHPSHSLVLVALDGSAVVTAARMDLPTTVEDARLLAAALDQTITSLAGRGVTKAVLVAYGTAEQADPHAQAAATALRGASIAVHDVLRVTDGRFWSSLCDNPACCPPEGTPFDPSTSPVAATAVAAGLVALPGREAVAAQLAPVTGQARRRMSAATADAAATLHHLLEPADSDDTDDTDAAGTPPRAATPSAAEVRDIGRDMVAMAREHYRHGSVLEDFQAALITVLLALPGVSAHAAKDTTAARWEIGMWADLVRRAEPGYVAGPALLLACAAIAAGDGTLANLAVDRALAADPANELASRLDAALTAGIEPGTLARLLDS